MTEAKSDENTFVDLGRLDPALAEEALLILIGLPLSSMWHPIFQIFEFGEQRPGKNKKGQDVTFGDWSLHVSCEWHVARNGSVIVGSRDMKRKRTGQARRFFDRKTPPRDAEERKRWAAANEFFDLVKQGVLIVQSVSVGSTGSLEIKLSDNFVLRTFNACATGWEQWCLLHRPSPYSFWVDARADGAIAHRWEATPPATE